MSEARRTREGRPPWKSTPPLPQPRAAARTVLNTTYVPITAAMNPNASQGTSSSVRCPKMEAFLSALIIFAGCFKDI